MRLGWLADEEHGIIGGAELTAAQYLKDAPPWVEVVACPPFGIIEGLDAYAVQNCTSYPSTTIASFGSAPVVKVAHDIQRHGDAMLKDWLFANSAAFVYFSPLQWANMSQPVKCWAVLMPPAIDLGPFREAAAKGIKRMDRTLWLGQMTGPHKGIGAAVDWALRYGPVDFYGAGGFMPSSTPPMVNVCGQRDYSLVPCLMAQYERFLFLPSGIEAGPRTILEASAAGCEVISNSNCGSNYWLEKPFSEVESGSAQFWGLVKLVTQSWSGSLASLPPRPGLSLGRTPDP